jgi:hypothetical protein
MDDLFTIFWITIIAGFFFLGPWILLWRNSGRRKRDQEANEEQFSDLKQRVHQLENEIKELQSTEVKPGTLKVEVPPAPISPKPIVPLEEIKPVTLSIPPISTLPPLQAGTEPAQASVRKEPPISPMYRTPLPPPPTFTTTTKPQEPLFTRFKSALDLEEALGTNWLNKLGIGILVLGVAFFLAYQLKTLGPAGKVLVGYIVSATMLGAGVWFERKEKYRILARAGIGGGWALLFFVTYAMYHVPAAHVLESQTLDLVLMLIVAAAMVLHTLRYRSQVVTTLAFLLAFLTVSISHSNVYSLSAGAVLAAGLVVVVIRMQWLELEIFGIAASYLNHYLWLRPIIEPMNGHHHPFPEFKASAGILICYWAIFRLSYVFRNPSEETRERVSSFAALLNTALLLALFKYQSTHPEWTFYALLVIGAIETALGRFPTVRKRRSAVIVLSTLGIVLLLAAVPFRFSGSRLSLLWLLEAEALLLIGVWTREIVFRRIGFLATALVTGNLIATDAAVIAGRRMDGADVRADYPIALLFSVAAIVFYLNAHWVFKKWEELFEHPFDNRWMRRLSYAAACLGAIATWIAFPESWTAVAWAAAGLFLMLCNRRFKIPELSYQAFVISLVALIRALAINLYAEEKYHGVSLRLITLALIAGIFYLTSIWTDEDLGARFSRNASNYSFNFVFSNACTWASSILLSLLAWYELRAINVALAWAIYGIILLEIGLLQKKTSLRWQAYLLFISSFFRIFFVNLNAAGALGEISPRVYTIVPLAFAFFYVYWRLCANADGISNLERKLRFMGTSCYFGTLSVIALMRFELPADWVAAAWAGAVFILLAIEWRLGQRIFLGQAILISFGVLFRTSLHNFYQRSYFPAPLADSRMVCVGTVVGLLLLSLFFAFRLRKIGGPLEKTGIRKILEALRRRPEQVLFFIAIGLLSTLLALEMRHGMVTVAWGLEAVMVFLFALRVGERSFRLTGLGLLLLCAAKILVVDVWRLNPRDRYLTLIVLGGALLLVSFLYTRYRETIRAYL